MVSTPIKIERVEDEVVDEPGQKTGKFVSVEGKRPLFMVRGRFAPGPVETIAAPDVRLYRSPRIFELELANGRAYRLTVDCPSAPEPTPEAVARLEYPQAWREPCPVRLHHGASAQELAVLPANRLHMNAASFIWAGDLDRDGRLDLLMDLAYHYNISMPTLFLSSAAGDGGLVAQVAQLRLSGC